jgi:GNAT superfamily N-acetyltransferase
MNDDQSILSALGIVICRALAGDAAIVAHHRVEMFRDMGQVPNEELASRLLQESTSALSVALGEGTYVGWLARDRQGAVIAGAGVHIKKQLPRITHDGARVVTTDVPLAVNVYTESAWRRRGIARILMHLLTRWSEEQGFDRVVLHASDAGRALYTSLGFAPTNEMRWWPPTQRDPEDR